MRDIVEEDAWSLYFAHMQMASICCAQERTEDKSSPRYSIDLTHSRLELCSLKGRGCEGFFFLVISINLHL